MMRLLALPGLFAVAACATATPTGEPSLARRSSEAIDPRLPVEVAVDSRPADPDLVRRIAALLDEARGSAAAFAAAEPATRASAAAAGPPQSESWIAAQLALSQLERTRAPFTRAFAEIDALRAAAARNAATPPADLAALQAAADELRGLGEVQAASLGSIRAMIAT